ncbi:sterol-4-alpha-carboxylate 3-dehydrogenase (decarboxylating) [Sugiyamaella lignohabitans]|uniref:Sterol-4-alpha-carboxylate 3-dehydrogenase (Decarboxylating) n=1 Tax=Sugiyamaella lignohabitans TaxID=796027 RepID=A0A167FE08_9ASCO|nr:sterol-4-alpha-carboxylate 3-dehydrogenase (decarboxylating) [Sugiyamaella lignohabitans]ANB15181.1 sterol-4-alpha-carboxylate 3-dehydrogenase (decarboxylating) [Sugiyamaella lignohabitans]
MSTQPLSIPAKKVLLVGGCGFLGLHLIDQFWNLSPRPEIHVFDIRELPKVSPNFYKFNPSQINVHIGDLTSPTDVSEVISRISPEVIVHSASPVHGMGSAIYYKVNVDGTKNLIACAKKLKVPALVYTSSAGVLFNGDDLYNADETHPFPAKSMDAYNLTKQIAEELVLKADSPEFRTTAIRPAGIFGPGDRQMIPALRAMGQKGQHKIQLGNNLNLFDVTYVGNVAYSHVLAAQKILDPKEADKVGGECFLITNDAPIYFWSLGRAVWNYDGLVAERTFVIPRSVGIAIGYVSEFFSSLLGKEPGLTPFRVRTTCAVRYYNITKAKTVLGYAPQTSLEEGINLTCASMDESLEKK